MEILGIEPGTLYMLSTGSTTELHHPPIVLFLIGKVDYFQVDEKGRLLL